VVVPPAAVPVVPPVPAVDVVSPPVPAVDVASPPVPPVEPLVVPAVPLPPDPPLAWLCESHAEQRESSTAASELRCSQRRVFKVDLSGTPRSASVREFRNAIVKRLASIEKLYTDPRSVRERRLESNFDFFARLGVLVLASACGNGAVDHDGAGASAALAGSGGVGGAPTAGAGGNAGVSCVIPAEGATPAANLVDTGCVDPTDPRMPAASAVTYEVNSPLWSDSADKARAFILPAAKKIHVRDCAATPSECPAGDADDGRWDFPIGTVMVKSFSFDDKLVETRLLMHTSTTNDSPAGDWVGYTYEWDEAQTGATLVPSDRAEVMFDTGTRVVPWHYPSRSDCLDCHTLGSGSTLGTETAQMNRVVGGVNQLDRFSALGLFETPPSTQAPLPLPADETAPLEDRARSYLHANCAFCHRPDGLYNRFDLRFDVALKDTKVCGVDGINGAIGTSSSVTLLEPGAAVDSLIWQSMDQADPDDGRMPQIGSYAIDDAAQTLVSQWIDTLPSTACTE